MDEALEPLLEAEKRLKSDEEVTFALYKIYKKGGKNDKAAAKLKTLNQRFPSKKIYAFPLAEFQYEAKKYTAVIKLLEEPSVKKDLDAKMSMILLQGYLQTKKQSKAKELSQMIAKKFPDQAENSLDMAILFFEQKKMDKAKKILSSINQNNPSAASNYYLGRIAMGERKWKSVIEHLTQAGAYKEDIPMYLGKAYMKTGKKTQAIEQLEAYYSYSQDPKVLKELYPVYKQAKDAEGTKNTLERLIKLEKNNLDYRVELAEVYASVNEDDKAQQQYSYVLKLNPSHPKANLILGKNYAATGDFNKAAKMLAIGLGKFPKDPQGWRALGDSRMALKQKKPALEAYKASFKQDAEDMDVALRILELTKALGLKKELDQAYANVATLDPNNPEAAKGLAHKAFKERNYKEAAKLYAKAVGDGTEDKNIWINYGTSLMELNKTEEAKEALQTAMQFAPDDQNLMLQLAEAHVKDNEMEQAEYLLGDILQRNPNHHHVLYLLGLIASKSEQPTKAAEYLERAIKNSPNTPKYNELLASIYYEEKKYAKAATILGKVKSDLSPESTRMYIDCLKKSGKIDQALREIEQQYNKKPTEKQLMSLVDLYSQDGKHAKVISLINASRFKKSEKVQFALLQAYMASGQSSKAKSLTRELIAANPDNPDYLYLSGMILYEDRKYEDAIAELSKALKTKSDVPDAYYYLGMSWIMMRDPGEAREAFENLTGQDNQSWSAKGFYGLGLADLQENNYASAAAHRCCLPPY
jgi:predicted Zn-dependent protease